MKRSHTKVTKGTVVEELTAADAIEDPHERWRFISEMSDGARVIESATACTASEFRRYLESCEDKHLLILRDRLAAKGDRSKVKEKLLASRIRRAGL